MSSHAAHDVCPVVAARTALELGQLLDGVRLTLAGQTRVLLVTHSIRLVTTDTCRETSGAVAFLVQHSAAGRQLRILYFPSPRGLAGEVGRHDGNLLLLQGRDHGS